MTIHEEFGETWSVNETDWIFSFQIASLILNDIQNGSPFNATYTIQFESEELKQQAEEVSEKLKLRFEEENCLCLRNNFKSQQC